MTEPYLHPKVEAELARPSTEGDRHNQVLRVLPHLCGDGWSKEQIWEKLRRIYDANFSDEELEALIDWGLAQNFEPTKGNCSQHPNRNQQAKASMAQARRIAVALSPEQRQELFVANTLRFLGRWRVEEYELWERSPIRPPEMIAGDAQLIFHHLFGRGELINVCANYTLREAKAQPCGPGLSMPAIQWCQYLDSQPPPQSHAGCWIRINPLKTRRGSVRGGSFRDEDVAIYRYHLLESDRLPMELQLALWSRLVLPIALILDSAGRSYHAWIKSYARTALEYRAESDYLLSVMEPYGIDRSNRNPSRFSRLPGVYRSIGARKTQPTGSGGVAQQIIFLSPDPKKRTSIF